MGVGTSKSTLTKGVFGMQKNIYQFYHVWTLVGLNIFQMDLYSSNLRKMFFTRLVRKYFSKLSLN